MSRHRSPWTKAHLPGHSSERSSHRRGGCIRIDFWPMKALVLTSPSGLDALSIQDVPEPTLNAGQTLIRVAAAGLNFADVMSTTGGYPGTPLPPLVVGREFSGIEEGTGRRVMGYAQWGAFAETIAAHPNLLWPVPEHWTDEQAAAFPVNYFTAYLGYWQAGMTEPMWGQPPRRQEQGRV